MMSNMAGLICLINLLLLWKGYESTTIPIDKLSNKDDSGISITDSLLNSENVHTTAKVLLQSKHLKKCAGERFSTSALENDKNAEFNVCMVLYDKIIRVSQVMDLGFGMHDTFLTNLTLFDNILDANLAKPTFDVITVCNSFDFEYQWNQEKCRELCFDPATKNLDPLCLGLFLIDREIVKEMSGEELSDTDFSIDDSGLIEIEIIEMAVFVMDDENNDTFVHRETPESKENMALILKISNEAELHSFGYLNISQYHTLFAICVVVWLIYHHRQLRKMKREQSFRNKDKFLIPQDGCSNLSSFKPAFSI